MRPLADGSTSAPEKFCGRSRLSQWLAVAIGLGALAFTSSAWSTNWYVRPAAAGANSGADWNNAWTIGTIAWSRIQPGDTIWIAGGTYGQSLNPQANGAAGNPILIKRVLSTDAAATSAAGWSGSFDSQVVISPLLNSPITWNNGTVGSYVSIDGRINSGIQARIADFAAYSAAVSFGPGCSGAHDVSVANLDMVGPGLGAIIQNNLAIFGIANGQSSVTTAYNISVTSCLIHGGPNLIRMFAATGVLFDHCKFYENGDANPSVFHPNLAELANNSNLTWRYCDFTGWQVEGLMLYGDSGAVYMYGCVWHMTSATGNRVIWLSQTGNSTGSQGPIILYNNTFVNAPVTINEAGSIAFAAGSQCRNNIYWNSGYGGSVPGDMDYEFSSGSVSGAHSISGGANPFVNYSGGDFHIGSTIAANEPRNKGVALAAAYSTDMDGNQRGADGAWDIGAYEYPSGGPSTNPIISISPSTLAFAPLFQGKSATNYFTVQNAGSGTLAGSASLSGSNSAFRITSGQTYSLSAGQTANVGISYSPASANDGALATFTGGGGVTATVSGQLQMVLSGLSFPSYAGSITAPFTTNGGYLSQTVDASQTGMASGGSAVYAINIPAAGNYTVSAMVNAPNSAAKSFWVNMDAQPTDPTMIWDVFPYTSGFESRVVSWRGNGSPTNDQFAPAVFNLSAGVHQLIVRGREAGVQLGNITIAPYNPNSILPPTVSAITSSASDVDPTVAGLQVFAGSAVQYSGSATDPNGYPLSWQWLYTVNGGAETVYSSGTGAPSGISFNYGSSTAGNTFVWKLRVSNGHLTSESDLTVGVEAPPVAGGGLSFQATAAVLSGPFALASGAISQSTETGVTNGGQAAFTFTITTAGNYVVQALVNAPSTAANSFFVNVDGQPQDPTMIFDVPLTSGFEQRIVSWRGNGTDVSDQFVPKTFSLTAGVHQLIIVGREANTQLQAVSILPLPAAPQHLRIVAGL
ncbi:MAG TPA: hypothetical protein VN578_04910 [Candidatus Binatia bacterium]|nr:hypothetical protein [Candidatus Binatia bacterium]